jgi:molybdopterin molybdotransferase
MPAEFIQVSDARKLIRDSIKTPDPVKVSINAAAGLILAEDIFSLTDVPPFNQSSMDGYAINYQGWKKKETLTIKIELNNNNNNNNNNCCPRNVIIKYYSS